MRDQVWDVNNGKKNGVGPCFVCKTEIDSKKFVCGHVLAESNGGETTLENLRPICSDCNLGMSTMHMKEYMIKAGKYKGEFENNNSNNDDNSDGNIEEDPNLDISNLSAADQATLSSANVMDEKTRLFIQRCDQYMTYVDDYDKLPTRNNVKTLAEFYDRNKCKFIKNNMNDQRKILFKKVMDKRQKYEDKNKQK